MNESEVFERLVRAKYNLSRGNNMIVHQELDALIQEYDSVLPGSYGAFLAAEMDRQREEGAAYDYPKAHTR